MGRKAFVLGLSLLIALLLVREEVLADKRPGKHTRDEKAREGQAREEHTHKHDTWEPPPPAYAGARSTRWDDPAAAA